MFTEKFIPLFWHDIAQQLYILASQVVGKSEYSAVRLWVASGSGRFFSLTVP